MSGKCDLYLVENVKLDCGNAAKESHLNEASHNVRNILIIIARF